MLNLSYQPSNATQYYYSTSQMVHVKQDIQPANPM